MAGTKVALFSYDFPDMASWPLPPGDWTETQSGQASAWQSAGDILAASPGTGSAESLDEFVNSGTFSNDEWYSQVTWLASVVTGVGGVFLGLSLADNGLSDGTAYSLSVIMTDSAGSANWTATGPDPSGSGTTDVSGTITLSGGDVLELRTVNQDDGTTNLEFRVNDIVIDFVNCFTTTDGTYTFVTDLTDDVLNTQTIDFGPMEFGFIQEPVFNSQNASGTVSAQPPEQSCIKEGRLAMVIPDMAFASGDVTGGRTYTFNTANVRQLQQLSAIKTLFIDGSGLSSGSVSVTNPTTGLRMQIKKGFAGFIPFPCICPANIIFEGINTDSFDLTDGSVRVIAYNYDIAPILIEVKGIGSVV